MADSPWAVPSSFGIRLRCRMLLMISILYYKINYKELEDSVNASNKIRKNDKTAVRWAADSHRVEFPGKTAPSPGAGDGAVLQCLTNAKAGTHFSGQSRSAFAQRLCGTMKSPLKYSSVQGDSWVALKSVFARNSRFFRLPTEREAGSVFEFDGAAWG